MLVYSKIIYSFLRDTSQLWREDAYLAPHFMILLSFPSTLSRACAGFSARMTA